MLLSRDGGRSQLHQLPGEDYEMEIKGNRAKQEDDPELKICYFAFTVFFLLTFVSEHR